MGRNDPSGLAQQLAAGAESLNVPLAPEARARLLAYLDLLGKWNRVYNLSGIRHADRMITHHLLDSLAIVPYIQGDRLLDVGSGAGVPGLVIASVCPRIHCTLLDSRLKKTRFLTQAKLELGLNNVEVVQARMENLSAGAQYSTITARAVAPVPELWALARTRLIAGGALLAMQGQVADEDARMLSALSAAVTIHRLQVPGLCAVRHLVVVRAPL